MENGDFHVTRFLDIANTQGELPILVFRGAHSLGLLLCKVCTAPEDKLPGGQAHQIQVIQKDLKWKKFARMMIRSKLMSPIHGNKIKNMLRTIDDNC